MPHPVRHSLIRPPPRRSAEAGLLPMINVVFLLLIFFLIAARLTPPEAFSVTLPDATSSGTLAEGRFTLLVGPSGDIAFGATVGREAALAALVAERDLWCGSADCAGTPPDLLIRADAMAPAMALPALLRDLGALGFGSVSLAVVPQ